MKNDNLFRRILSDFKKADNKGFVDALHRAMEWNQVDIRNALGKPLVPGNRFMYYVPPI